MRVNSQFLKILNFFENVLDIDVTSWFIMNLVMTMEYSIKALSKLAGVSTRTLRYYDEIGLLKARRLDLSNYRVYEQNEVDVLQQILFFRELGFALEDIKTIMESPDFDREQALRGHLAALTAKKAQLERLIKNVTNTIETMKGDRTMSDQEKFEGLKQNLIDENEAQYGAEVRAKYGDTVVDTSNQKLKDMTQEKYNTAEELSAAINETLIAAVKQGNPAGELAQRACELHKEWLCMYWPDGMYTKEAHMGLGQMYCDDERFKAYYDKITPGCAEFLRDALAIYTAE